MVSLVLVQNGQQRLQARALIWEYLQWINEGAKREYGLTFDIEAMVASDLAEDGKYRPPFGRFYLAHYDERVAGVGCLKRLDEQIGEIQRMYVRPEFRGKGIGRAWWNASSSMPR